MIIIGRNNLPQQWPDSPQSPLFRNRTKKGEESQDASVNWRKQAALSGTSESEGDALLPLSAMKWFESVTRLSFFHQHHAGMSTGQRTLMTPVRRDADYEESSSFCTAALSAAITRSAAASLCSPVCTRHDFGFASLHFFGSANVHLKKRANDHVSERKKEQRFECFTQMIICFFMW